MLQKSHAKGVGERASPSELMGAQGRALTPLRPAGTAFIDGRRRWTSWRRAISLARDEPIVVVRSKKACGLLFEKKV